MPCGFKGLDPNNEPLVTKGSGALFNMLSRNGGADNLVTNIEMWKLRELAGVLGEDVLALGRAAIDAENLIGEVKC